VARLREELTGQMADVVQSARLRQMMPYADSTSFPAPVNLHPVATVGAQNERGRLDFRFRRIIDVVTSAVALLVLLTLMGILPWSPGWM
jgi:hypothetical protein